MSPSKQGKKGKPVAAPADTAGKRRRLGLAVFGVLLIGLFVGIAAAKGIGSPELSDDAVISIEGAPDGDITQEEVDRSLEQTAARQGLREVPPTDDEQFELLRESAVADLILSRWVLGEAEDRGIEVTERAVAEELERVIDEEFGGQKAFDRFLEDNGFTEEEATQRIELQLISDDIQESVLPGSTEAQPDPEQLADQLGVTDEQVSDYYEENSAQFEQPETRDVRVIVTKTEVDADEALAALEEDSTPKGFEEVAKKYSIDEATKATGGLREAVAEGESEPVLDEQIFTAPEGELVGPFETDAGFTVIRVESVTPASTTPLDEARDGILQTLVATRQQQVAADFQSDFTSEWRARTVCAEEIAIDRCSNAPAPDDPCTEEVADSTGCGAVVPSTKPIAPGSAVVFGSPAAPGLPQGPVTDVAPTPEGVPPGLLPTGPGGAPVPPSGAPPTAPPAAPPGG